MKLWIGNIAPGTTDEELRELVARYGVSQVGGIEHVPGDGTRPAAVLEIDANADFLRKITQRLNGVQWKGRALNVQAVMR